MSSVRRIMVPCKVCSKIYTKRGMNRHLQYCQKRRLLNTMPEFKHSFEHDVHSHTRKMAFIQGFHNYLSKRYNTAIIHENLIQEYIGMYLSDEQIRRVKRAEQIWENVIDRLPTHEEKLRESLREIETREYISDSISPAQMWDILTIELEKFLHRRADFFREQYEIERLMDEHCGLKKNSSVKIPLEIRPVVHTHEQIEKIRGLVQDFVCTHISKRQRT